MSRPSAELTDLPQISSPQPLQLPLLTGVGFRARGGDACIAGGAEEPPRVLCWSGYEGAISSSDGRRKLPIEGLLTSSRSRCGSVSLVYMGLLKLGGAPRRAATGGSNTGGESRSNRKSFIRLSSRLLSALPSGLCGEPLNGGLDRELAVRTSEPEESFEEYDSVEKWYGFPMSKSRARLGLGTGGASWYLSSFLASVFAGAGSASSTAADSVRRLKDLEGLNELMLPISSRGRMAAATDGLGRCSAALACDCSEAASRNAVSILPYLPGPTLPTGEVCERPSCASSGCGCADFAASCKGSLV